MKTRVNDAVKREIVNQAEDLGIVLDMKSIEKYDNLILLTDIPKIQGSDSFIYNLYGANEVTADEFLINLERFAPKKNKEL